MSSTISTIATILLSYLLLPPTALCQSQSQSNETGPRNSSRPAQLTDAWSEVSSEDYAESLESTKPDRVDDEAIQGLVDRFLNKGTLEEAKTEKVNKEAQALVNSSAYWTEDGLKPERSIREKTAAVEWLKGYSAELQKVLHQVALCGWNYFTSASPLTRDTLEEAEEVARKFLKVSAAQSRQFDPTPLSSAERKQLELASKEGMNALPPTSLESYNKMLSSINDIFTHARICDASGAANGKPQETCLLKFSDLHFSLQSSENAQEILEWWRGWRRSSGPNLTQSYAEMVRLTNEAAKLNGYSDGGAMWRSVYEEPDERGRVQMPVQEEIERCYEQIQPLYKQLHAYVRPRLAAIFGAEASGMIKDGPIPVHLLSRVSTLIGFKGLCPCICYSESLSGESWSAHFEHTKPFGDASEEPRLGDNLVQHFHSMNYTARTMFTKVYRFMKWLGFERLPRSVWMQSVFSRNWSKENVICHPATAYDMVDGDDYRIKACLQLGEADWVTAHRLMAQLYYKFVARKQPLLLREPTNPSLSAALSGAFEAVAMNVDYLKANKLLSVAAEPNEPSLINRLYKEALEEVVKLPFDLIADKWRYAVFEGRIALAAGKNGSGSGEWWAMREKYQGLAPPAGQVEAASYDAAASPAVTQQHAPASRHFVSYVARFQVLKRLCQRADMKTLSDGCVPDKEAMKTVMETMAKGGAVPWLDAFEALTGSRKLDAAPLMHYFEPLTNWLENSNQHEGLVVGWDKSSGAPFQQSELPQLRKMDGEDRVQFALGNQQIAFPGGNCVNGQECLLDSVCNGTICVCKEGLHTLQIADTYNCVPGDPRDAGFEDGSGGLIIALTPKDQQPGSAKNTTVELNLGDGSGAKQGKAQEEKKGKEVAAGNDMKVHGNSASSLGRRSWVALSIVALLGTLIGLSLSNGCRLCV